MMSNTPYTIPTTPIVSTSGGSGFGGGNGDALWIFALLVLFGGGGFGGGFGGRGGAVPEVSGFQMGELSGKVATKDSIQTLQNSTNQGFAGLNTAMTTQTSQLASGISTATFEIVNRISALSAQVASCCCEIQRQMADGFGQVRYDMATLSANTNATIADWGNKILADNARRAEMAQAQRINQLELQSALCGIPKVANAFTYPAPNPYAINNCGCGC